MSLTVELPRELVERFDALVKRTTWDASGFLREALEGYIPHEERELDLTEGAIAEMESGAPGIPHEKVVAWMESFGASLTSCPCQGQHHMATRSRSRLRESARIP